MARLLPALAVCLLLPFAAPVLNRESPVLWRDADSPVVRDIIEVHQDLLYLSPCYMFNNATVDPDNVADLSDWCQRQFESDFLVPFRSFCRPADLPMVSTNLTLVSKPVKSPLVRHKRVPLLALPLLIPAAKLIPGAILSIVSLIGVTFGITSLVQHNSHSRFQTEMQMEMEQRRQQHERLGRLLNDLAALHAKQEQRLARLESRVNRFISMYPSATTLITDVASKLSVMRSELRTVGEQWKKGKIDPTLFTILSIDLQPDMDSTRAVPLTCSMDEIRRKIKLSFRIPVTDSAATLMQADAFRLLSFPRNDSLACTIRYAGPRYAIFNQTNRCVSPVFDAPDLSSHLVFFPSTGNCFPPSDTGYARYYRPDGCRERQQHFSVADMIQVKATRSRTFVYCFGSNISFAHAHRQCPEYPFALPSSTNFTCGSFSYRFSQAHWQRESRFLPEPSHYINTALMPDLHDLSANSDIYRLQAELALQPLHSTPHSLSSPNHAFALIVLFLVLLLVLTAALFYLRYRVFQQQHLTDALRHELQHLRSVGEDTSFPR